MVSETAAVARGFPPVHAPDAELLVLGSMPGVRSLQAAEYYAHPRNAFWRVMAELFDIDPDAPYARRLAALRAAGVALWDVIASCRRRGSLDQRIDPGSVVVNDFGTLFACCPRIGRIAFNGAMAETAWRRHVAPGLSAANACIPTVRLPSTSPAHAAMRFEDKLAAWRRGLLAPP
jgi:hypoxanthine-DNA glycosylase